MVGTIFEYHSPTHGYHKWVVVRDMIGSKYCICAIISSKETKYSIKINSDKCNSVRKVSFIQTDNLLSVKKDIVKKSQTELLCSSLLNELKLKLKKIFV